MSKRTVQTLTLIVDNEFGVLTRVTALVRREGWNIKSLVVAETMNPTFSRLTISVECIDSTLPHVLERLGRLACVRAITAFAEPSHIGRELVLATVEAQKGAEEAAAALGAGVLERSRGNLTVELAGTPGQVEALLQALRPFGISNVARSGIVTLERAAREEQQ